MTAEQELLSHWRGVVESRDFVGVPAFADHLAELWPTVIREDAENFAETGYAATSGAVIDVRHEGFRFRVCQLAEDAYRLEMMGTPVGGKRAKWVVFDHRMPKRADLSHPPPDRWEYELVETFVSWLWSFLAPKEEAK